MSTDRFYWVDYAKAIGIILVVYGHVLRGINEAGITIPTKFYELSDSIVYSFHMPLFFFISGYFFINTFVNKGASRLAFSKIDTIAYPYIIWSILHGCIEVILSNYTNGTVTYTEVFSLFINPRAHFWFLYALFAIFLISILFFNILINHFSIKIIISLYTVCSITFFFFPSIVPDLTATIYFRNYSVYFALGILFSQKTLTGLEIKPIYIPVLTILFISCQFLFHSVLFVDTLNNKIVELFLATLSILFVISVSQCLSEKPHQFLIFIGKSSMAIYILHILSGSGIRIIMQNFLNIDSFIIHLAVGCLFGILIPLLCVKILSILNIRFAFSVPISNLFLDNKRFKKET